MDKNKKRKAIAGILSRKFNWDKIEKNDLLKIMKRSMFYRTRPRLKSELIKPVNKKHRKKLNEEEKNLGITTYV